MMYGLCCICITGALAFSTAYFGQGTGIISYDNVHCIGNEKMLQQCNHLNQSNCVHSADAGVRCALGTATFKFLYELKFIYVVYRSE